MSAIKTLNEFIIERQADFPYASGDLTRLLADIGTASKIINQKVNRAGLTDVLGAYGSENVQGEEQQKLDVFADEVFINYFRKGGEVCGIASEENEGYLAFEDELGKNGKYVVLFDPLDGSSNIDVNVSIGTIFSIYRRKTESGPVRESDFLRNGREIVAAGYLVYGSSTMLVYSTGNGVNGFTLDPSIGEFLLSHPDLRIPDDGTTYRLDPVLRADHQQIHLRGTAPTMLHDVHWTVDGTRLDADYRNATWRLRPGTHTFALRALRPDGQPAQSRPVRIRVFAYQHTRSSSPR